MPLKVESPRPKIPVSRILSLCSLVIAVVSLALVLRTPKPVAPPRTPQSLTAGAQSLQTKVEQLATPAPEGESPEKVRLSSDEIAAAIAQAAGTLPAESSASLKSAASDDNASMPPALDGLPSLTEPVVTFEGDQVRGQFVSELGGKKVYITVSGHLGAKDGYATFDPTEFKVGDLNVPVSLVNDALQKKMIEERDKMRLPDFVSDVKVENGELVVTRK